jgi:TonB family protein
VSVQQIARSVSKPLVFVVVLAAVFASVGVLTGSAQQTPERRIKNKVTPTYPELARKMNLAGAVRLEVTVAPNGTVKDTKVIGGNPILVNAATDAVKKWRFEAANDESTQIVEFKFDPSVN